MLLKRKLAVISFISVLFSTLLMSGCEPASDTPDTGLETAAEGAFEIDQSLCDFHHTACKKQVGNTVISLRISPENTPSEKPLSVTLTSTEPLTNLAVRVEGRDMFMGVIPLFLDETSKNTYQGTLIYGSCSSNYMVWRLIASFDLNGENSVVMYDFLADSQPSNG